MGKMHKMQFFPLPLIEAAPLTLFIDYNIRRNKRAGHFLHLYFHFFMTFCIYFLAFLLLYCLGGLFG